MYMKALRHNSPIGLDLGAFAAKAVQLKYRGGKTQLHAATLLPCGKDDPPLVLQRLTQAMDRQGFVGRRVVIATPANALMSGVYELPARDSGAPLEQLARMELSRAHKREPDAFESAMWELPTPARAGNGTHVMATACGTEDAEQWLDAVEAVGLDPIALDVHPLALARACQTMTAHATGMTAILDLGATGSRLVLLLAQQVVYDRALSDRGCNALRDTLGEQMKLDTDGIDYVLNHIGLADHEQDRELASRVARRIETHMRSVAEEARASLSYGQMQYPDVPIDRVILTGGGAGIAGLDAWLGDILQAPTETISPARLITCDTQQSTVASSSSLTLALGLALHGRD